MPRNTAFHVLQRVEEGAYSHIALSSALDRAQLEPRDRGLATHLVYATLTWQQALDSLINRSLSKGVKVDTATRIILRLGVVQLYFMDRIPEHAAVSEAVEMAKKRSSEKLVNAVLRRLSKDRELWYRETDKSSKPARYLSAKWSFPTWLANRMVQQLGEEEAEKWMEVMNQPPPIWLRSRTNELQDSTPPGALKVDELGPYMEGLKEGTWVVQDLAAQLVGHLVGVEPGMTVWDACAGLGGKALHLADLGAKVVASDPNTSKLDLLRKAHGDVEILEGKAQDLAPTLPEFDCVLLDAPCTSLGVIRRHPETRWTRLEHHITNLAKIQSELLDAVAPRVKPSGLLVYSVCTFTREETSKQVESFLKRHPDFEQDGPFLVTTPVEHDSDAFFAARLRRKS
jgi:16S rRNA (cytosine967-C5)-methyltransferase